MNRLAILVLFCLSPLIAGGASGHPAFPIFVYAPLQEDSPLHIVGLQYGEGGSIRFTLINGSDKSISKVAVAAVEVAPPGCGAAPRNRIRVGGSVEALLIPPHGSVVTPGTGHFPIHVPTLITNAKRLEAASLHVQIVVTEVDFVDGNEWSLPERKPPFDSSLADADAGKCPDAAAVTKALRAVERFEFDPRIEKSSDGLGDGASTPPRLSFFCSLEGSKAVCPL
ncbi:MAG: hypothetical protein WAN65_29430 [Candidatus Sulfotelmatobacter sp.]